MNQQADEESEILKQGASVPAEFVHMYVFWSPYAETFWKTAFFFFLQQLIYR